MNKEVSRPDNILESAPQNSKDLAQSEAEVFSEEKLEHESKRNEHGRKEASRNIFHWGNLILFIVLYALSIGGILTLGYHWIFPQNAQFATPEQLDTIKNILFSALATNYAKEFHKKNC